MHVIEIENCFLILGGKVKFKNILKLKNKHSQIQDVYMAQYEKNLKRKMQSIIYDANIRGVINEISLVRCEQKRKVTEDRLNNLRVKLAALLQKLQLVSDGTFSGGNKLCGKSTRLASSPNSIIYLLTLDKSLT